MIRENRWTLSDPPTSRQFFLLGFVAPVCDIILRTQSTKGFGNVGSSRSQPFLAYLKRAGGSECHQSALQVSPSFRLLLSFRRLRNIDGERMFDMHRR